MIGQDQKQFVDNKIRELGSLEEVLKLYNTDSPVDVYARKEADKLYGEKK